MADSLDMALTTFDTQELIKDLKAAGFNDTQAEAVTQAVKNAREIDLSDLATKAEITALRADIALLATKLDNIAANYAKAELSVCGTTLFAGH